MRVYQITIHDEVYVKADKVWMPLKLGTAYNYVPKYAIALTIMADFFHEPLGLQKGRAFKYYQQFALEMKFFKKRKMIREHTLKKFVDRQIIREVTEALDGTRWDV